MALNNYFEILNQNYCQTTTQFAVNNNTATVENILNPDRNVQFYSDGMNNDATTVSMTITFDTTTTVSRISLLEHNLKSFRIFYNGATANTFALTTTAATTTAYYATNSQTSHYFRVTPAACTSVTIDMYSTQVANSEKAIGHLIISDLYLEFSRMPNSSSYTPRVDPEQVLHQMSDGGFRTHTVRKKYAVDIKLQHITTTFRDQLKALYDLQSPFIFCPFGTTTSWDGIIFEAIWPGNFEFYKYSENALASGFSGSISLKETSS